VRWAACGLDHSAAVAFAVGSYPDNSVVAHANRLAGGEQDVFVGACALLLDASRPFGFFPNLYNEDWLFAYDALVRQRVSRVDRALQVRYDPFAHPQRAMAEEFGDIIAEGLMAGLHPRPRRVPAPTNVAYWREYVDARRAFIERIALKLRSERSTEHARALRCLEAAEQRARTATAECCASYIGQWRADLHVWQRNLAALRPVTEFDAAAECVGLSGSVVGLTA
jgi:hypothetical protein